MILVILLTMFFLFFLLFYFFLTFDKYTNKIFSLILNPHYINIKKKHKLKKKKT
ncbi:hypothetical protein HanRHA438_Chr11g0524581 [Helianthus annuus]|nr:hypothetical protein HanRHA438_Chr11g0524581 [Helianthus annuus]